MIKLKDFAKEYCTECAEPIQSCTCSEVAFTTVDGTHIGGKRFVLKKMDSQSKDCSECSSYNCTSCPRYTTY